MPILIESPTAEAIFAALRNVPVAELARLREMLAPNVNRSIEWSDEDLADFSNAGAALYEELEAQECKGDATPLWFSTLFCFDGNIV